MPEYREFGLAARPLHNVPRTPRFPITSCDMDTVTLTKKLEDLAANLASYPCSVARRTRINGSADHRFAARQRGSHSLNEGREPTMHQLTCIKVASVVIAAGCAIAVAGSSAAAAALAR